MNDRRMSPSRSARCCWRYTFQAPLSSTAMSELGVAGRSGARIVAESPAEGDRRDEQEGEPGQRREREGDGRALQAEQRPARVPGEEPDRQDCHQASARGRVEAVERELPQLVE